jgi:hypothetical protein
MNTNDRLDLLEKKIDLVMNRLGLSIDKTTQEVVQPKADTSHLELELQKVLNEIRVLKIKFRKIPANSPARQGTLEALEKLNVTKTHLEADLNATR